MKGVWDLFVLVFTTSHGTAVLKTTVQRGTERRWQAIQTERTLCIKAKRYRILGSEKGTMK